MLDVILETLLDTAKLVPFLFLTYLLMEWLEQKTEERSERWVRRSGKLGPLFGGFLGIVPQCGFSAAAAGLYGGGVVTLGTLFAIFLSTSDEMLPILVVGGIAPLTVVRIVAVKVAIAVLVGFVIDLVLFRTQRGLHIHELCEDSHCHCDEDENIWRSALYHTLHITFFLLLISLVLHIALHLVGEETISSFILDLPVLGNLLSALVGLIPNCAASVVITQLYVDGVISVGTMLSGLLTGSGIGLLVLFRSNRNKKQTLLILAGLYVVGATMGILLDLTGLGTLLVGA